jgi:hypothetical protein
LEIKDKLSFAQNLHHRGLLWSYDAVHLDTLPESILIEHALIYGDIPDIKALFELFSFDFVKKTWKKIVLPNPNHRKLNYFLAIFYFHYKNPTRLLNKKYETRIERLQRLAAQND